jgi:hypothetical protein
MKLLITNKDGGWQVKLSYRRDDAILSHESDHATASEAAREVMGTLRLWAADEDGCGLLQDFWLVTGQSDKSDGFARIVSARSREEAVAGLAAQLELPWGFSVDDQGERCAVISMRETMPEDGWETPRWFWQISCSPLGLGTNLIDEEAWEWPEEVEEVEE